MRDHIVHLGIGDDVFKVLHGLIAMLRQTYRHFRDQRLCLGVDYIFDAGGDIERSGVAERSWLRLAELGAPGFGWAGVDGGKE